MFIALGLVVLIFIVYISCYNLLIRKRNLVTQAFGSVDAILKKRFDLIPNLVATVQQYAAHEKETFSNIVALRNKSYTGLSDEEKVNLDRELSAARRSFFAVAENYPQLRASENFMQLQRSLNETEEQLSAARRAYNAAVTDYNNSVQMFPSSIVASMSNFTTKEILVTPEEERKNVDVKKLFNS